MVKTGLTRDHCRSRSLLHGSKSSQAVNKHLLISKVICYTFSYILTMRREFRQRGDMNKETNIIHKLRVLLISKATTRKVLISLGFYLLSIVALNFYDIQIARYAPGITKPDLQFGYTSAVLYEIFTNLGSEGRQIYLQHLVVDSIMPVLFALAVLMVVARVIPRWFALLSIAPVTFMVLDLVENASLAWMLTQYPAINSTLVSITSVITMIKLSAFMIAMPTLVLTYAGWIIYSLLQRRSLTLQKR